MSIPFTVAGHRTLLNGLRERGYVGRSFHDHDPVARHLIIRHDIDMSTSAARRLAESEAADGWCATYFVLMRSELYNPFAPASAEDLMAIAGMGHEIGLHFDAGVSNSDASAVDAEAARECRLLEDMTGTAVRLVSFHRPAKHLLGFDKPIAGRLHTYMTRFFSGIGYCSDSQGGWHHGMPGEHAAVAEGRALQLLTHPIWWVTEGATPVEKLEHYVAEREARLDSVLADNCRPWKEHRTAGVSATSIRVGPTV